MYRDQFGEFMCGHWGLKANKGCTSTIVPVIAVFVKRIHT